MQEFENPWQTTGSKSVYENAWINVIHNDVITPSGKKGIYGMAHFKNIAAAIVPIDENFNTYLVGQYRYPLNEYSWEVPMGGVLIGNNVLEGAQRELLEETGLVANTWKEIAKVHTSNSVTDEVGYVFLATELVQQKAEPEETEQLIIKKLPFKEAYQMVMKSEITDSLSIIAILKIAHLSPPDAFM